MPIHSSLIPILWACLCAAAYTFIGYPLLAAALGRFAPRPPRPDAAPASSETVSVIVIACNEASRIAARIRNLRLCERPGMPLEIIVVSDGSADRTAAAAREADSAVKILEHRERAGKAARLNEAIPAASGSIVVLTDARQAFAENTVSVLRSHLSDPAAGAVSGALEIDPARSSIGEGVDSYWRLEKMIRAGEAAFDSCIGCTGAVYAIRRELFQPLPADTILDDVVIPMRIAMQGRRILFSADALAYDSQPLEPLSERRRKQRTLAGNFQMLCRYPAWLLPWKNRLWWQLISHKYLRLFSPLFLFAALLSNAALLSLPFYRALFAAQVLFYALALLGAILPRVRSPLLSLPSGFVFLNWMAVRGFLLFLKRNPRAAWRAAGSHANV